MALVLSGTQGISSNGIAFVPTPDSLGRTLSPNQPSFLVGMPAGSVAYILGQKVTFNFASHNVGNNFDTVNSRFTAPLAGRYLFMTNIYCYTADTQICFRKNNTETNTGSDVSPLSIVPVAAGHKGMTTIFNLAVGDYIEVFLRTAGTAGNLYGGHSHFSGHLLG